MRYGSMKVTQMPPVHAANLVANSDNTAYRVDVIATRQICKYYKETIVLLRFIWYERWKQQ